MKIIKNILRLVLSIFTEDKEDEYREVYDTETNMED